jgi:hypothetical protein
MRSLQGLHPPFLYSFEAAYESLFKKAATQSAVYRHFTDARTLSTHACPMPPLRVSSPRRIAAVPFLLPCGSLGALFGCTIIMPVFLSLLPARSR